MIAVDAELLRRLAAEARLAPSVHNVQPTRLALDAGAIVLRADPARALPAADPKGHDLRLSHGAFLEGLALAAAGAGLALASVEPGRTPDEVARVSLASAGAGRDPLGQSVPRRASWRGTFRSIDDESEAALDRLAATPDLLLVRERGAVARIAASADVAGLALLREPAHRTELLHWMRLSPGHPDYGRDGLNAEALALGRLEAIGAGWVLGPLFGPLDRIGLAGPLTAERGKAAGAAAMALFHRPEGEDPLETGRAFYRAWLAITEAGLAGCPVSVLVDWPQARAALTATHPAPSGRRLVNVFRIGIPAAARRIVHARLPVGELILGS